MAVPLVCGCCLLLIDKSRVVIVAVEIDLLASAEIPQFDFSIILPVYNEGESLKKVCLDLKQNIDMKSDLSIEVIFVDDASSDRSLAVIQNLTWGNCRIVRHLTNLGHQQALLTGLFLADGKYIGMMDADGQHPASEMFKMFENASAQELDLVQGIRLSRSTDGLLKKLSARLFYMLMHFVSKIDFTTDASDFRVLSNRCKSFLLSSARPVPFRFSLGRLNLRKASHQFDVAPRIAGKSKYSFQKMNSLAISSFTNFSDRPLRFIASLGIATSLFSTLLILSICVLRIIGMTIPGWASLAALISIFGALNLLSAGIIALYLSVTLEHNANQYRKVELVRVYKS